MTGRLGIRLLIAIAAFAIAAAAAASALPGRNTVNSGDIQGSAVKRKHHAVNQRTEWVIIDFDTQSIVRQSGGISLGDTGTTYSYVDFGHNVRSRPLYARDLLPLGPPVTVSAILCGPPPQGVVCDDPAPSDNTHVYVQTQDPGSRVYLAVLPK